MTCGCSQNQNMPTWQQYAPETSRPWATECPCASSSGSAPQKLNFEMLRGDSFVQSFRFLRPPPGSSIPLPVDITSARIWFTVKRAVSLADNRALAQKTVGSGVVIDTPLDGAFTVALDPVDTAYLADGPEELNYDVRVEEHSTGRVTTVAIGIITVQPNITRAPSSI